MVKWALTRGRGEVPVKSCAWCWSRWPGTDSGKGLGEAESLKAGFYVSLPWAPFVEEATFVFELRYQRSIIWIQPDETVQRGTKDNIGLAPRITGVQVRYSRNGSILNPKFVRLRILGRSIRGTGPL